MPYRKNSAQIAEGSEPADLKKSCNKLIIHKLFISFDLIQSSPDTSSAQKSI